MTTTSDRAAVRAATDGSVDGDGVGGPGARRRWLLIVGIGALVIVLVGAVIALTAGGDSGTSGSSSALRTTRVARRDLIARLSFDGTLGYVNPVTLSARAASSATSSSTSGSPSGRGGASTASSSSSSSSGPSTVTSIAPAGQVVTQGQVLFALDGNPTVLLYGATPAYRELSQSSTPGPDILQLEYNLSQLGYHPGTVDDTYTSQTAAAVKAWETDLGRPNPDGNVELGEVVFENGPVRVGAHSVEVGGTVASGGAVMSVSGTTRVVTLNVDASRQNLVHPGNTALVTFPDGSTAEGLIFAVSKVATSSSSSSNNSSSNTGSQGSGASAATTSATVPVTIVLPATAKVPDLDQAPVTVGVTQEERANALSVPVTALLALSEGGYGLEIVEASGQTRIVAVRVGVYADGYVEVSGPGISVGTKVVSA
jgi:hypothetical protein